MRVQAVVSVNQLYPGGDLLGFMRSLSTGRTKREGGQAHHVLCAHKAANMSRAEVLDGEESAGSGRRRLSAFTELTPAQIRYNACPVSSSLDAAARSSSVIIL
jgi:hypothetical protein